MRDYVRVHFRKWGDFVAQVGGAPDTVRALIDAGAAPGPIYSFEPDGSWWSALGAAKGDLPARPAPDGQHWFAKSATWWVRRAILCTRAGASPKDAAASNLACFIDQFVAARAAEPLAAARFAGEPEADARKEWGDWLRGGFGVCMMSFSGESCVRKESYVPRLRALVEGKPDPLELLDLASQLSALLLPFAPMERPSSSAGLLDRSLALLGLGFEAPYG